ncbi:hypothetical protein EX895_001538 [Sporisorium graminicola]|uniref:Protein kinase domain-containing protein n=1 Tax=Sporisorium graminicola TaxID=280036 RepID=A0A4U7KYE3_9BASI|nr:hypothetical protein EX895_001538 [Sporisorium graminicola]TKY89753.1 hypothetical protein EX895_001538 [Sporisorium graminicola]
MLKGQPYGTATDIWSLGNVLWELFTGMLLHREMDANPCKYNIRINVRSVHQRFALSHAVEDMLSQKDDVRPSTSDLFSDPGILETLSQLWRQDISLCLGGSGPSRANRASLSPMDKGRDGRINRKPQYETAVSSPVMEGSRTSRDESVPVFSFRRIKLG